MAKKIVTRKILLSSLPRDVFIKIVLKLPMKEIVRLMCVSNEWHDIIISKDFLLEYLKFNALRGDLLRTDDNGGFEWLLADGGPTPPLEASTPIPKLRVLGSFHGLVCLGHASGYSIIWNPTVKKYIKIPEYPPKSKAPAEVIGFCYDTKKDDYKIVKVISTKVMDYSLRRKNWGKSCCLDQTLFGRPVSWVSVYCKNGLYWMVKPWGGDRKVVVKYDIITRKCHGISLPDHHDGSSIKLTNWEWMDDSICFLAWSKNPLLQRLEAWILRSSSWNKLLTLEPGKAIQTITPNPLGNLLESGRLILSITSEEFFLLKENTLEYAAFTIAYGWDESRIVAKSLIGIGDRKWTGMP